jgi:GTPase
MTTHDRSEHLAPTPDHSDGADVERALRAGLEDFDLTEEDRALLEGQYAEAGAAYGGPLPVVAVVGRPNVGKSTLVNRILGRREAVVEDVPGVTRDRVSYSADWSGRRFTLVDTGGWAIDARGSSCASRSRPRSPIEMADAVMFVVDAVVGATDDDEAVVRLLRRSGKPVVLVANKVDDQRGRGRRHVLWSLGLGQPYPVSACTAGQRRPARRRPRGAAARSRWPGRPRGRTSPGGARRQAQRRQVVLLNKLAGRSAWSSTTWRAPPATRSTSSSSSAARPGGSSTPPASGASPPDPRRGLLRLAADPGGSGEGRGGRRARRRLRADRRAGRPGDPAGDRRRERRRRGLQQVGPTDEERRHYLEREIERELVQVRGHRGSTSRPMTGRHVDKLVPAIELALASWDSRIPTGGSTRSSGRSSPATRTRCAGQAAPHPVRHPGRDTPADVRALHHRVPRGRLPPVRRAPPARGVRLRGHADRGVGAGPREAPTLRPVRARDRRGQGAAHTGPTGVSFTTDSVHTRWVRFVTVALLRAATGCGAAW